MSLPPKLKEAAEAAFDHNTEVGKHYLMSGVQWLWDYLSSQEMEFDEKAWEAHAIGCGYKIRSLLSDSSLSGAHWQFERDKARIFIAVSDNGDLLNDLHDRDADIKALKAKLKELEDKNA